MGKEWGNGNTKLLEVKNFYVRCRKLKPSIVPKAAKVGVIEYVNLRKAGKSASEATGPSVYKAVKYSRDKIAYYKEFPDEKDDLEKKLNMTELTAAEKNEAQVEMDAR